MVGLRREVTKETEEGIKVGMREMEVRERNLLKWQNTEIVFV